jgi:hypothetical protein
MPDCNALSTRLRQIWLRLFSANTEELEPILRHEACLIVHKLLIYVRDLGFQQRKTVLHKAWHEFDYRSNGLFVANLGDSSHETPARHCHRCIFDSCLRYTASVARNAQIHAGEPTLSDPSPKILSRAVFAQAAEQLGISKQLIINRSYASSGTKGAKRKWQSAPSRPVKTKLLSHLLFLLN